jgi:chromosome segregation protein
LPLDHLPAPAGPPPDDTAARWAARSVAAPTESLVHYLLGRVAIVDHLDQAEALWRRNGVVATYVTPGGEVLGPTGRLHGGGDEPTPAGFRHSLLGRKRQLREIEEEVVRLTNAADAAHVQAGALGSEVGALRERLSQLEEELQVRQTEKLSGDKDLEQAIREHERLHRHAETVRLEAMQVSREAEETGHLLAQLERRMALASEAESTHEAAMSRLRETIEAAQARESALVADVTACRVEIASAAERVEALTRELVRLDQMEADLAERWTQARTRQAQLRERSVWLTEERERVDLAARAGAVERDTLEAELRGVAERHAALVDDLASLETQIRRLHGDLGRLTASVHEIELRATEGRVRREELVQETRRAHGIEESELVARHDPGRDLEVVRTRHAELAERLESIGPVNLVADDEYRELDERLTFLRTQHDDLTASIKDLEKALRGMTRTAQARFDEAFAQINEHFRRIFGRLFEGGHAELRLVEAEEGGDPLETGVELMAQPRGKRLLSVTLMSGGERALTGLALLFAIFYFRPSPFCVLDEVDAPLDDANIHRFLRVLRELTSQTQFLVITHNRKTMEAADVLYGVTMEEPGLSKMVSVALNG